MNLNFHCQGSLSSMIYTCILGQDKKKKKKKSNQINSPHQKNRTAGHHMIKARKQKKPIINPTLSLD